MTTKQNQLAKISATGRRISKNAPEWEAVIDDTTDLMWSVPEQEVANYDAGVEAVAAMTAGGYTDWRLPTVDELFALADRTRSDPAIDTNYFPDCESSWYLTSTPYVPSPNVRAWVVDFNYGDANWYYREDGGFVRAVRGDW